MEKKKSGGNLVSVRRPEVARGGDWSLAKMLKEGNKQREMEGGGGKNEGKTHPWKNELTWNG